MNDPYSLWNDPLYQLQLTGQRPSAAFQFRWTMNYITRQFQVTRRYTGPNVHETRWYDADVAGGLPARSRLAVRALTLEELLGKAP